MTPKELLARAVEFDAGPPLIINGHFIDPDLPEPDETKGRHIRIVQRYNALTGSVKWAIHDTFFDLNKTGNWEYAQRGSRTTEPFLQRCRYDSVEEAFEHYEKWKAAMVAWARKKLAKAKPGLRVILKQPRRLKF